MKAILSHVTQGVMWVFAQWSFIGNICWNYISSMTWKWQGFLIYDCLYSWSCQGAEKLYTNEEWDKIFKHNKEDRIYIVWHFTLRHFFIIIWFQHFKTLNV